MAKNWSDKRKRLEDMLCESLKRRVDYHVTFYTRTHNEGGRGWITLDGDEIFSTDEYGYWRRYKEAFPYLEAARGPAPKDYHERHRWYVQVLDEFDLGLARQQIYWTSGMWGAILEYLRLDIDSALSAVDPLTRAIAFFDRRVGTRRLRQLSTEMGNELTWVRRFYEIRVDADLKMREKVLNSVPKKIEISAP